MAIDVDVEENLLRRMTVGHPRQRASGTDAVMATKARMKRNEPLIIARCNTITLSLSFLCRLTSSLAPTSTLGPCFYYFRVVLLRCSMYARSAPVTRSHSFA